MNIFSFSLVCLVYDNSIKYFASILLPFKMKKGIKKKKQFHRGETYERWM